MKSCFNYTKGGSVHGIKSYMFVQDSYIIHTFDCLYITCRDHFG